MFSKVALFVAALALSATAIPASGNRNQCNTGHTQCCNSVEDVHSEKVVKVFNGLGISIDGLTNQVGFGCHAIGGEGSSCDNKPVCCQDDGNFAGHGGLISVNCTPIDLHA